MNTTMVDSINVPFTIVRISDNNKQYERENYYTGYVQYRSKLIIRVENIKLIQAPTETFHMYVEIDRPYDTQRDHYESTKEKRITQLCHTYYVKLTFVNHLHEFNKDYKYEVVCKIADSEKQEDEFLFGCTEPRLSNCVETIKRFAYFMNHNLTAQSEPGVLYFCIRRRVNDDKNVIYNERLNKAVSMFRNTGCDVVLKAKDSDVRAHKSILSQNSEVFRTMFAVEMREKESGIIDVSDFEIRVINKMLDYLYTGEVGELEDMTEALFKLAHRYQLQDLCRHCEEYYTFDVKVDNDNIVGILELTELYELKNLNECAVKFANSHERELVMIPGYIKYLIQSINSDNLLAMLLLSKKYKLENLNECAVNFSKLHEEMLLTTIPEYREYVIQCINLDNAVNTLLLAVKYGLTDMKMGSFDFIKNNYLDMMEKEEFLNLFESNAILMKEIHVYVHKKEL